jgi:hypothetical protein
VTFEWDEALLAALRSRPENAGVLDAVGTTSAHGDLGEVLFRYGRSTGGMRVIPVAAADFPALVATPADDDVVVAAATGMQSLLLRTREVPARARLAHERALEVGADWWRVHPFDPEVDKAETADELQRWFTAASTWR